MMFQLFRKKQIRSQSSPSGPKGQRAYVIGDIHGCFAAMKDLLIQIEADNHKLEASKTSLIFLGDLIDRGPESKNVLEFLCHYRPNFADVVYITGNHEECFSRILSGHPQLIYSWFESGGRGTARSYGVENLGHIHIDVKPVYSQLRNKVPRSHIDFLSTFKDYHVFGDYLCVHAGIKPKISLDKQKQKDMHWIRSSFINYKKRHSHVVVHGHTVVEMAVHMGNRIAIDTGAGKGGYLSCVCLEDDMVRFMRVKT